MEDDETVDTFKMAFEQEDKAANISPELSGDKRAAGNAAFQKKKDDQALGLYSEAAMTSLTSTEAGRKDAAMALANRSAVWVKLKKYEEGLDDVEAAQYFGYPANMMFKVVDRQAKCLAALGRAEEATACYNRVILLLKQSNLDADKQAVWKKDVEAELEKLKTALPAGPEPQLKQSLLAATNARVPQFSDAVEITYSPLVGRHGVATRDIPAGEVVMVDTATTVHLLCGARMTNCTHCTSRVLSTTGKPSPLTPTAR
jgi:tetratricopeptide (TPR) repeat protein